jgi:hypothetical protein
VAFILGLFIAMLFVDIFQCHPVPYVYDLSIKGETCIDPGGFYVSTAALNLFHRSGGLVDPGHHHLVTANADPAKTCHLYYSVPGWSVSPTSPEDFRDL